MTQLERGDREEARIRERLHKLEATVLAHGLKLDYVTDLLKELGPQVDVLARASEIADEVERRMHARGTMLPLNWVGKAVAMLVACSSVASVILAAMGHR